MSFEYRELATQVFLNAGEKSPGHCDQKTKPGHCDYETVVPPCPPGCDTGLTIRGIHSPDDDKKEGGRKKRKALASLRQQLREALAAG